MPLAECTDEGEGFEQHGWAKAALGRDGGEDAMPRYSKVGIMWGSEESRKRGGVSTME